ncbi:MAG TPA: DNA adenine methylase [Pyrinomonadaceae bacterium]|nr:DNA adenine methylase [Pyrinomonadaceae bacterium]
MNNPVLAKTRRAAQQHPDRKGVDGAIKPPLKWAGGKRWVIPYLSPLWKPHQKREYVEPFCGGLAAALRTAEWLHRHKGPVVLSNQATDKIVRLYRKLGFGLIYLEGPRRISCTGDRAAAKEVLALKGVQ